MVQLIDRLHRRHHFFRAPDLGQPISGLQVGRPDGDRMQEPVQRVDRHTLLGNVVKQEMVQFVELFIGQKCKGFIHRNLLGSLGGVTGGP